MEEISHQFGATNTDPWGSLMYSFTSPHTTQTNNPNIPNPNALVAPPIPLSVAIPLALNSTSHVAALAGKEASSSSFPFQNVPSEVEAMKAKIISHPLYTSLVGAYLDCQKVGASPEVTARLSAVAQELEVRQRSSFNRPAAPIEPELDQFMVGASPEVTARLSAVAQELEVRQRSSFNRPDAPIEPELDQFMVGASPEVTARLSAVAQELEVRQRSSFNRPAAPIEPELDQFMEAYHGMLVKYREELTRPMQETMEFLRCVETQLNTLVLSSRSPWILSTGSSEEDQEGKGGETKLPEINAHGVDQKLKHRLLKKYSGYLSSLKQELSKKKKGHKLPEDALHQLFNWWEMHYKWPYPSETQKMALARSTGLDLMQINNWFINQRKRHWKPSNEMQFVKTDGYHPPNAASGFYMDGHILNVGICHRAP